MRRVTLVVVLSTGLIGTVAMAQKFAGSPAVSPAPQGTELDLAQPFHAHSAWRFVVTEGPPVESFGENVPGALNLCFHKGPAGPCVSDPVTLPLDPPTPNYANAWDPHYLVTAEVVFPQGPKAAPFLLIVTGSLYSGDGDRVVSTQLVTYDADRDTFRRVFGRKTYKNNNQEIRFVTDGPLRGSVISAEPQNHPPYGYWIVVYELTPAREYHQVLRYSSATHYNDGNPLPVIDSEMPNIERRLGLWRRGDPIPTPVGAGDRKPCLKPILKRTELWCG